MFVVCWLQVKKPRLRETTCPRPLSYLTKESGFGPGFCLTPKLRLVWLFVGWMNRGMQFTPISAVDRCWKHRLSLHISNCSPYPIIASPVTPPKGPRSPPLPPLGNCQTQPAGRGPPAAAASRHCSTASPPGRLSEAAGKIGALSNCAWERDAGIKVTGMLRARETTKAWEAEKGKKMRYKSIEPRGQCQ